MTPTRLPVRSTSCLGQRLVNSDVPANVSIPAMSGSSGADRMPAAATTNGAVNDSPASVFTIHVADIVVEGHRNDVGVEPDVAAEVQPVGDEVEVGLDLGLGGHRLRPHPLLLDLVGEAVGVLDALDVAARTGIPVEQPCPADLVGPLDDHRLQPELSQPVQGVQTGEPGTDDDRVEATS